METVTDRLTGQLVVSCQAGPDSPLRDTIHIVALARAAVAGGARGLRIEGIDNVAAVRASLGVPIIGIVKRAGPGTEVFITPSIEDVERLSEAGADIVAFDATIRPRPAAVEDLCTAVRRLGRVAMADVSTIEEARAAVAAGAHLAGTTLAGYTPYSRGSAEPDFELMREMAAARLPFVAEGRIWTPEEAAEALDLGARFVVVGSAITRPDDITRRFAHHIGARTSQALAWSPPQV